MIRKFAITFIIEIEASKLPKGDDEAEIAAETIASDLWDMTRAYQQRVGVVDSYQFSAEDGGAE